ncbi:MAG: cobalamin-independent methionine synthase II family protein [SAR202 cluster bacterium]|nr:cobalamin-independent methionine synthase II family protein [SAR202 cluster bacterium]
MPTKLFPTTVVGSMPRPQYIKDLVEAQAASGQSLGADFQRMMDSAVPYVAQMQEMAGIDIISDGEWRRKSYIGVIADICSGFELSIREVNGQRQSWHIVTGEIRPNNPGQIAREARFLREHTSRDVKVALPSPYLLGQRMWDPELSRGAYPSRRDFTEALVPVLRDELIALRNEGVAIAQFDDPQLCLFVDPAARADYADPDAEMMYCVDMLNRIVDGVDGIKLALHLCRRNKGRSGWLGQGGYVAILPALKELELHMLMMEFAMPAAGDKKVLADLPERFEIGLGCIDCRSQHIDTPEEIVARVKQALEYVAPHRITLHPDCGFAPGSAADIPIDEAYLKLKNEAIAAQMLRDSV